MKNLILQPIENQTNKIALVRILKDNKKHET